jgi:hypothetical protein
VHGSKTAAVMVVALATVLSGPVHVLWRQAAWHGPAGCQLSFSRGCCNALFEYISRTAVPSCVSLIGSCNEATSSSSHQGQPSCHAHGSRIAAASRSRPAEPNSMQPCQGQGSPLSSQPAQSASYIAYATATAYDASQPWHAWLSRAHAGAAGTRQPVSAGSIRSISTSTSSHDSSSSSSSENSQPSSKADPAKGFIRGGYTVEMVSMTH